MSSALNVQVGDVAARERNREHHGFGGNHAPPSRNDLGFAERRVREAEHVADFVQRDRLDVEAVGAARLGRRPGKRRIEKDVGLEQAAVRLIDRERRGGKRSILVRPVQEPEDVRTVLDERRRLHEADELRRDADVRHVAPGRERAIDGGLKLLRGHAADAGIRDEIPDRELTPPDALGAVADARAELEVGAERDGRDEREQRRHPHGTSRHRRAFGDEAITARTRAPNSANGSGFRSMAPRVTGCGVALESFAITGGTTMR